MNQNQNDSRTILKFENYRPRSFNGSNHDIITIEREIWDWNLEDLQEMFEQLTCALMQNGYIVEIREGDYFNGGEDVVAEEETTSYKMEAVLDDQQCESNPSRWQRFKKWLRENFYNNLNE